MFCVESTQCECTIGNLLPLEGSNSPVWTYSGFAGENGGSVCGQSQEKEGGSFLFIVFNKMTVCLLPERVNTALLLAKNLQ